MGQLAGVAHAYHTLGVAEPGLLQAIGDQVGRVPRAHAALTRVYGTGGNAMQPELQAIGDTVGTPPRARAERCWAGTTPDVSCARGACSTAHK